MILSLIEYGDVIYAGTTQGNLSKIVNLFYRGLRICDNTNYKISKEVLCDDCIFRSKKRNTFVIIYAQKDKRRMPLKKNTCKNTIASSSSF